MGSEANRESLPGFVVMRSGSSAPGAGSGNWTSGFLPSSLPGSAVPQKGDPVLYLSISAGFHQEAATLNAWTNRAT